MCDTDRKVGLAYGATIAGQSGGAARLAVVIGPDGKIKAYYPKVSAKSFPAEVVQTL